MQEGVNTVFTVSDQATGPIEQLAKASANLEKHAGRAKAATDRIGGAGVSETAAPEAPSGAGTAAQRRAERLSSESFQADKEEMLARRARTRHTKLHMQKEMLLHRAAESGLLMMVGEENKYAKQVTKYGVGSQMLGAQLAGMGGTVGKVGSTLARLGGIASMAGLGIEALSFIDEVTGGHIEHAGETVKNWASHLVGMTNTQYDLERAEEKAAKSLGFRNVADYKVAEATEDRWRKETELNANILRNVRGMKAMPANADSLEGQEAREAIIENAKDTASRLNMDLGPVIKMYEEALSHTSAAALEHANREAQLSDVEKSAIAQLSVLPINANAAQMEEHTNAIRDTINRLLVAGSIYPAEAEAVTKNLLVKTEEEGSIRSLIERHQALETETQKLELVAKAAAAMLPKKFDRMGNVTDAYSKAFENIIPQIAEQNKLTPEQTKRMLEGVDTKKAQHHFDFRNSRFDIKQAFAEGFDPGRIAVAFTNDLAMLGERRLQSGLAPIFAAR